MQYIGLPSDAEEFLTKNDETINCDKCGSTRVITFYEKKHYVFEEMFYEDGVYLHEYYLDGKLCYREELQCVAWSSGPMVFLKLVGAKGNDVFVWSEKQIQEHGG